MTLVSIIEAPATGELEASGPRAVLECSILLYGGSMKTSVINILMLATLASVSFGQEFPKDAAMKQARKFISDFYSGNTDGIWKNMTPEMQAALKTQADFANFATQVKAQIGRETSIENERVMPGPHAQIYTRLAHFSQAPMPVVVLMSFDDQGKIGGFVIRPEQNPAESKYLNYRDKTVFTFPLKGTWLIYQGGRSTYDNYHAAAPDQRFAYDIVGIRDGKMYAGSGDKVEDYFCFGQPVVAPANGVVVVSIDQYDDNPLLKPSQSNPPYGNGIVLDHGDGEFSMFAHLKHGSVRVKAGDNVKTGQELGQCGNSGNSPFPHLHYHVQTTAEWFKGDGLPVQFHDYAADGKAVTVGEPIRGEIIQSR